MKRGVLAIAILVGIVSYAHVTDNMGMAHETGIAVGLVSSVLVAFWLAMWLLENDDALRDADHFHRKHDRRR
jgi:preprotein translocase subunit SecF